MTLSEFLWHNLLLDDLVRLLLKQTWSDMLKLLVGEFKDFIRKRTSCNSNTYINWSTKENSGLDLGQV